MLRSKGSFIEAELRLVSFRSIAVLDCHLSLALASFPAADYRSHEWWQLVGLKHEYYMRRYYHPLWPTQVSANATAASGAAQELVGSSDSLERMYMDGRATSWTRRKLNHRGCPFNRLPTGGLLKERLAREMKLTQRCD